MRGRAFRALLSGALFLAVVLLAGCAAQKQQTVPETETAPPDTTRPVEEIAAEDTLAAPADTLPAPEELERIRLEEAAREAARREAEERARAEAEAKASLRTVYFAFDASTLDAEARSLLQQNAEVLRRYPGWKITVEGHCDERGSTEYNLALGERRAAAVRQYYIDYGVDSARIRIISYGEERPAVRGSGEDAWAKNRRAVTVAQ